MLPLAGALLAFAAAPMQHASLATRQTTGQTCTVDRDLIAIPVCATDSSSGRLRVRFALTGVPKFNRYGLAAVLVDGHAWMYVDHRGYAVVEHVAVMDNGANAFHHGLVRVTQDHRWGLADQHGRLVVPMHFAGMYDYDPHTGYWLACSVCTETSDGEHSSFRLAPGEHWLGIDTTGRVVPLLTLGMSQ